MLAAASSSKRTKRQKEKLPGATHNCHKAYKKLQSEGFRKLFKQEIESKFTGNPERATQPSVLAEASLDFFIPLLKRFAENGTEIKPSKEHDAIGFLKAYTQKLYYPLALAQIEGKDPETTTDNDRLKVIASTLLGCLNSKVKDDNEETKVSEYIELADLAKEGISPELGNLAAQYIRFVYSIHYTQEKVNEALEIDYSGDDSEVYFHFYKKAEELFDSTTTWIPTYGIREYTGAERHSSILPQQSPFNKYPPEFLQISLLFRLFSDLQSSDFITFAHKPQKASSFMRAYNICAYYLDKIVFKEAKNNEAANNNNAKFKALLQCYIGALPEDFPLNPNLEYIRDYGVNDELIEFAKRYDRKEYAKNVFKCAACICCLLLTIGAIVVSAVLAAQSGNES